MSSTVTVQYTLGICFSSTDYSNAPCVFNKLQEKNKEKKKNKTWRDSRKGYNDEEGTIDPFVFHEVGNESNGLDGLS